MPERYLCQYQRRAINKNSECLEFDAKGQGKIKISLETGEVVNGIRYGHTVTINTNDEWAKKSVCHFLNL